LSEGDDKRAAAVMASALEQFVNNVRTLSKQGMIDSWILWNRGI